MFETEAGFAETKMLINCNGDYSKKQDYKKGWQDGAEFGYNKGYHDAEEHYLNVIDNQHKLVDESKKKDFRKCIKCTDGTYQSGFKDGYNKAKEETQAQIEKMKCCGNCKHQGVDCEWFINHKQPCTNLNKWQLKEIKEND